MYRHMLEKNHSIDWKNASFVFNNKNREVLQMVESTLISKISNFNLSSGSYCLHGNIAQDIVLENCDFEELRFLLQHPCSLPCWHLLSIIHHVSGAHA